MAQNERFLRSKLGQSIMSESSRDHFSTHAERTPEKQIAVEEEAVVKEDVVAKEDEEKIEKDAVVLSLRNSIELKNRSIEEMKRKAQLQRRLLLLCRHARMQRSSI